MNPLMQKTINLAHKAMKKGELPIACIIFDKDKNIISSAYNNSIEQNNATSHAEILAINEACTKLGLTRLENCDMYVTLEPCAMCAYAISIARINRLFFGAYNTKGGAIDNGVKIYNSSSCFHKPETYGGIMEKKCSKLLTGFFKDKRKQIIF